jgi:hypothetical protein
MRAAREEVMEPMRRNKPEGVESRVQVPSLAQGDRIELCTARSRYVFFVEFPELAIGVAQGGVIPSPSRVRLTAEGTATDEEPNHALAVGERVQFEVLDPSGRPSRKFLTSPIATLTVSRRRNVAA